MDVVCSATGSRPTARSARRRLLRRGRPSLPMAARRSRPRLSGPTPSAACRTRWCNVDAVDVDAIPDRRLELDAGLYPPSDRSRCTYPLMLNTVPGFTAEQIGRAFSVPTRSTGGRPGRRRVDLPSAALPLADVLSSLVPTHAWPGRSGRDDSSRSRSGPLAVGPPADRPSPRAPAGGARARAAGTVPAGSGSVRRAHRGTCGVANVERSSTSAPSTEITSGVGKP